MRRETPASGTNFSCTSRPTVSGLPESCVACLWSGKWRGPPSQPFPLHDMQRIRTRCALCKTSKSKPSRSPWTQCHATPCSSRLQAIENRHAKTNVPPFHPIVGDYIVVARQNGSRTKMTTKWVGPRRMSTLKNNLIVEVENLLNDTFLEVHITLSSCTWILVLENTSTSLRLPPARIMYGMRFRSLRASTKHCFEIQVS